MSKVRNDSLSFLLSINMIHLLCQTLTCQYSEGIPKVLEICGEMIMEKLYVLNKMPHDWLQQQVDSTFSLVGIPYAGLVSSLATFQDDIVICDTGTNFYWTNHLCVFMDIVF